MGDPTEESASGSGLTGAGNFASRYGTRSGWSQIQLAIRHGGEGATQVGVNYGRLSGRTSGLRRSACST
jgi:hypothetical protein